MQIGFMICILERKQRIQTSSDCTTPPDRVYRRLSAPHTTGTQSSAPQDQLSGLKTDGPVEPACRLNAAERLNAER
jgi:hypothetical protein